MKNIQLIFTLLIALTGAVLCFFYYKDGRLDFNWEKITNWGKEAEYIPVEPQIKIPESGVKSNALAIREFQTLLEQNSGNIVFSPLSTELILRQLAPLSDATLSANIESLVTNIGSEMPTLSNSPTGMVTLFVDKDIPLVSNARTEQLFRVPFMEDRTLALADINNYANIDTAGIISQALSTAQIPRDTKLLAVSVLAFAYDWVYPMEEDVEEKISFFEDSISLPYKVSALKTIAKLRYIKDYEYDAIALFYQSDDTNEPATCLMVVMPKFLNIRDFSASLSTEILSSIRKRLAEATPTMIELRMPSFESHSIPISQKNVLSKLGCDALFTEKHSLPYLCQESCVLKDVWQVISYRAIAKPLGDESATIDQVRETYSNRLVIDRPFIWIVGDLTTDNAPLLMGTIESLK